MGILEMLCSVKLLSGIFGILTLWTIGHLGHMLWTTSRSMESPYQKLPTQMLTYRLLLIVSRPLKDTVLTHRNTLNLRSVRQATFKSPMISAVGRLGPMTAMTSRRHQR